jgi:hypothetical protein
MASKTVKSTKVANKAAARRAAVETAKLLQDGAEIAVWSALERCAGLRWLADAGL